MKLLKKYPIPISGTALGLASLGNLLRSYSEPLRTVLGLIAAIIIVFLVVKFLLLSKPVMEAMENPVVAGTMATFPMTLMVLSTYIAQFKPFGMILWYLGVILHVLLIVWFSLKFLKNFNIKKVFPTWFILYVGIAVAPLTAAPHGTTALGMMLFWFAFIAYFILVAVVSYRVFKVKEIPDPAKPTLTVFAAPGSLLLAAYMAGSPTKNLTIVYILLAFSLFFWAYAVLQLPKLLMMKFNPAFSSFTFPFAISGLASKLTNGFLTKAGNPIPGMGILINIQEILSLVLVLYVLFKYLQFMFAGEPKLNEQTA